MSASVLALLSARVVRGLWAAPRFLADRVSGSSWSRCVTVVSVIRGVDRVSVVCSDGHTRVCRVGTATRALNRPIAVEAVFAKMSARVGSDKEVRFLAAFGYSADDWFVACFTDSDIL